MVLTFVLCRRLVQATFSGGKSNPQNDDSMKPIFLAVALLFSVQHLAQSAPIGAVVQTWRYDPQTHSVIVRLLNESDKDITAFNLSVTEKYADGKVAASEKMTDYLPLMASVAASQSEEMVKKYGNGTFAANTSRDVSLPAPNQPIDVSVTLDMVAYADQTTEVINGRAFDNLVASRKAMVLAIQQANKAIKDALSAPNPRDAAVKELTRLADVAKTQGGGIPEMAFRERAQNARQAMDLATLAKESEVRLAVYTPHAQLVKGGRQ